MLDLIVSVPDHCLSFYSAQVEATIKKFNSLLFLLGRIKIYLDIPTRKFFSILIFFHIWSTTTLFRVTAIISSLTELSSFRKELQD